jgi:hypothetical protein
MCDCLYLLFRVLIFRFSWVLGNRILFPNNLDNGSTVDIDEFDDETFNGFGGVSSDDEAHDEPRVHNISVRTGVLDEKAAATQALGLFSQHTKSFDALFPFTFLFILVFFPISPL